MCPAMGELEHGDPETVVEHFCEVGHLRALALGVAVPEHGPCAFCPGGARHASLLEKATRLNARERLPWAGSGPAVRASRS